jgi:hypothetical protein
MVSHHIWSPKFANSRLKKNPRISPANLLACVFARFAYPQLEVRRNRIARIQDAVALNRPAQLLLHCLPQPFQRRWRLAGRMVVRDCLDGPSEFSV